MTGGRPFLRGSSAFGHRFPSDLEQNCRAWTLRVNGKEVSAPGASWGQGPWTCWDSRLQRCCKLGSPPSPPERVRRSQAGSYSKPKRPDPESSASSGGWARNTALQGMVVGSVTAGRRSQGPGPDGQLRPLLSEPRPCAARRQRHPCKASIKY